LRLEKEREREKMRGKNPKKARSPKEKAHKLQINNRKRRKVSAT